jgi:hypothetical protein
MWFNEDDDFDDGEAVVPAANDILGKKLESDMDSIGMSLCSLVRIITKGFSFHIVEWVLKLFYTFFCPSVYMHWLQHC